MTGFAASHTGSLTPSSDPWTFVGTVTWQSDIDPAILPDNEPVVLRLAFTTLVAANTAIGLTDYRVVAIVSDPTLGSGWATLATAITDGFIDGTGTTPRTFNAGANVWVGSERDAAQWFNGDIAEILRFNRALTPTETNQVGAYLAARYRAVWVGV